MGYMPRSRKRQLADILGPSIKPSQVGGTDGQSHSIFRMRGRDDAGIDSWEDLLKSGHILHQIKFVPSIDSVNFEDCLAVQGVLKGYSNRARLHDSDIWRVKIE